MEPLKTVSGSFLGLPRRAQMIMVSVVIVTLVVLVVITRAAVHTEWATVQSNIRLDNVAKSTDALRGEGVKYRTTPDGTSIQVAATDIGAARVALAKAGALTNESHASYEQILDKKTSPVGLTQEQYKLTRQRLLEGLVANDLERINGIEAASVRLVLPEDELFSDEQSRPTAAVSVDTLGNGLTGSQARAVAQLTAASVKNMKPVDVSIVDEEGHLYQSGDGTSDSGSGIAATGPTAKLDIEDKFNRQFETKLQNKIEEIVGEGNVKVFARATINVDQTEQKVDAFGNGGVTDTSAPGDTTASTTESTSSGAADDGAPDTGDPNEKSTPTDAGSGPNFSVDGLGTGAVVAESVETESLANGGTTPGGTTGTSSNTTTYPATTGGASGNSDYVSDKGNRTYAPNHLQAHTKKAPGNIEAFRVGIILDEKLDKKAEKSAAVQAAVENAVRAYIGIDPDNTFDISFAPLKDGSDLTKKRKSEERRGQLYAYAKWFLLGIGMLAMAFFLRRSLNQRTMELLQGGDEDLLMLERGYDPIPLKELEAAVSAASSMENQKRVELQRRVEGIVQQKPENVAMMLRGWLHDEQNAGRR